MNLKAQGDISIVGDVVGRDKITNIYQYGEKKERPAPRMAPPAPRVFIGRDEVLRELIAALKLGEEGAGPNALTALKGMGGIGKTTLAAALANHPEVETALPEGTLWAGLGPEPEVMSLLAEWGTQLGEEFAQFDSPETRSRRLSTLLHDKKALLIVDDVWHAEPARYFLVGGPRCRALITTRDNEIARKLAGHEAVRVETLTDAASLNLLRELAPEAVTVDEKAANELATVLDGLPLALTLAGQMLAAEWETGLGVAGALSELKDREARLKLAGAEKRPGLATTEPSLRAILAMSYDRLPDEATKRAFRLLGVFGGKPLTFSIEAAAAMWGTELRPAQKTMVALVGRALVEPVDGGRYNLHTTLADFAESLLEKQGQAATAREVHANYYLNLAQTNAEKNWQAVEMEIGQIRGGFDWISLMSKDKQMVLDYERALRTFLTRRGLWNEKIRWTQVGLEVAFEQGERTLEAVLLYEIGHSYDDKGEWNKALEYYERSRAICEEIGDRAGLAAAFNGIGGIHHYKGLFDEALDYYERSRAIREEIGDRGGLAQSLNDIGGNYMKKGLWDEALDYHERSRAIREEIGDRGGLAQSLNNIGYFYRKKGLWDEALECCERSRAIRQEIGDRGGLARALSNIGDIYMNKGVWDEALEYYERGQAIFEEIGEPVGLAWALCDVANVYEKQTRLAEAEQLLGQAVAIFDALGSPDLDNARKQLDKIRELQRSASQK
ncbi:tetratricopeptide repeat protein [candidate division KSB1 bacterium]|nr:tetratricopeptide repeat protein [candidate division KSB1 bacterium]